MIYTDDNKNGDLQVSVTSWRTQRGDRMEVWGPSEEQDGYALLQTHRGRVVAMAVAGGHGYVLCNLLEFYNSDGSMDMPNLLQGNPSAAQVGERILKHAEQLLYGQIH